MEITPLDAWIAKKIGSARLTPDALSAYQRSKLYEIVEYSRGRSRKYREKFSGFGSVSSLRDFQALPFTTPGELSDDPTGFLCVAPDKISRIVTLRSSGTEGEAKRVFFTPEDQELTVDFFRHGMMTMAASGERVMIFMPGATPGSVGDLLAKGLTRFGAEPILYGGISDYGDASRALLRSGADVAVGMPSHLYALSRMTASRLRLKSALLASDYMSPPLMASVEAAWGCKVYRHYGLTETGLGGGVDCSARLGYHLREADLYFEIIDPQTGEVLPDGQYGEVVFTTLTRIGMPLIRYRTGDLSRIVRDPCPCASALPRLDGILGRLSEAVTLKSGETLSITQLDDILYGYPEITAFGAALTRESDSDTLTLSVCCDGAIPQIPELSALPVRVKMRKDDLSHIITGQSKRKITDLREELRSWQP